MANKGQLTENFHIREFKCKDGTQVPNHLFSNVLELAKNLQFIRNEIGCRLSINSAYRHAAYNRKIGGSPNSQHLTAKAADLVSQKHTPRQLRAIIERLIKEKKISEGGLGLYPSFVHYDIRGTKSRFNG